MSDAHDPRDTTNDPEGTPKPDGLGEDGTIPDHPEGVAAGFAGDDSHFNHEEDEDAQ
ncbi:hypothetical protein HUN58_11820 [Curtobacterium sp. Csp1]|uniref:hypothetical protein n=1 Tax=unclassified Curtobacterium TaxID=257496 RepID=UPI000E2DA36F|nr:MULTISPECIES: hypothetical protein [unclassified Curtobacterium]QKS12319.1 hypothetical protein HUN60_03555 [Curtobacterium sp. csp3]QKS19904.1 hypothetical protein HUN58_08160 [Curtobacterium sp. Csp1]QKS20512.1 hypothetical protein HUN58_11820 [Curtobacterium sp. Csp1]RDI02164.1 hypothetical protein DEU32_10167 [Curtobacterium sp. AG1037]